jgi:hypothetical protein
MTGNPVADANARTMWKRETPPIAAISSSVSGPARWLSMYQSAFWAGFMADSFPSKRRHLERLRRASFDSPCSLHPWRAPSHVGVRLFGYDTNRPAGRS